MTDTVTVYCKLPHGLRLDHPDHDTAVINGVSHTLAQGDHENRGDQWDRSVGVTRGVSAGLWNDWKARHAGLPAVKTEIWAEPEGATDNGR